MAATSVLLSFLVTREQVLPKSESGQAIAYP
jgi:hypothetical protein